MCRRMWMDVVALMYILLFAQTLKVSIHLIHVGTLLFAFGMLVRDVDALIHSSLGIICSRG